MQAHNTIATLTESAKQAYYNSMSQESVRSRVIYTLDGIVQEGPDRQGMLTVKFRLSTVGYLTLRVHESEVTLEPACERCGGEGELFLGSFRGFTTCPECRGYRVAKGVGV